MAYPKITLSAFAFAGALVLGAGVSSLAGTSESSEQDLHPSVKLTGPTTVQAADGAVINDAALISGRVTRVPTQQGGDSGYLPGSRRSRRYERVLGKHKSLQLSKTVRPGYVG